MRVFHGAQLLHRSYLTLLYMISSKHYINNNKKLKEQKLKHMAQYADGIAISVTTTLRKHTNKTVVNHVQKNISI